MATAIEYQARRLAHDNCWSEQDLQELALGFLLTLASNAAQALFSSHLFVFVDDDTTMGEAAWSFLFYNLAPGPVGAPRQFVEYLHNVERAENTNPHAGD